jgi:putative membrane protein
MLAASFRLDGLAGSMAIHIVLMGAAAPITAAWLIRLDRASLHRVKPGLVTATALQVAVLYLWHLPAGRTLAMDMFGGMFFMQGSLALVAVAFWLAVFSNVAMRRWSTVLALLLTAKLFCLLGVLLVFARRPLYLHLDVHASLADQQLAGLLMLSACPLTYLAAAFVITCRGIDRGEPVSRAVGDCSPNSR